MTRLSSSSSRGGCRPIATGSLPPGVGPTLELVRALRFGQAELDYLRSLGLFAEGFLDYLREFRFSGDVDVIPEGTGMLCERAAGSGHRRR